MKLAGGAIAAAGIGTMFTGFVKDAAESAKIGRLTEAVLKSTGGAAKISADQVGELATAISNKTAVDDEQIQSASNLLLTFTKVRNETGKGNDIFNQATQAAVDMSVAMGTDANGAALQLGKALNDPIKGVTALSKAGVSFTQQQKDQIKAMVEAGDTLGAQKIILGEMQTQFGGAAAAAADPMERLRVVAGNLGESIGGALLPAVEGFASFATGTLVPGLQRVGDFFGRVKDGVGALWDILVNGDFTGEFARVFGVAEDSALVDFLFDVREALEPVVRFVKDNATPILAGLAAAFAAIAAPFIIGAIGSLAAVVGGVLAGAFGLLLSPVGLVALAIGGIVAIFVAAYKESEPLRAAVEKLKGAFDVFIGVFKDANGAGGIQGFFDGITAGIAAAWPLVKAALAQMGSALWEWIQDNIAPALAKLGEWMSAVGSWILGTGLPMLWNAAKALGSALWDWIGPMIGPALAKLGEWMGALGRWIWGTGLPWLVDAAVALGGALIGWIGDNIGPMLGKIAEWGAALIDWIWGTGLPWLLDAVVDLAEALIDWIVPQIPGLLGKLAEFMGKAVGWIFSTGIPLLVGGLLALAYKLVEWVLPQLPGLLVNMLKFFGKVVAWVATDALPMLFNALWSMGSGAIRGLWESISNSPLVQKLTDIFQGVVDAIGRAWDGLKSKLETPIRAVINFVNDKVIDNLNKVTKVFGLTIPDIPKLADGAIVRKPTMALIGEAGPEVVLPLSASRSRRRNQLMSEAGLVDPRTGSAEIGGPWDFVKGVGGKVADGVGNLVDAAGNVIGNVKDAVGNAVSWTGEKIADLVAKGVGFALEKIIRPVGGWIADQIDNPFVRHFTRGIFDQTATTAKKWGDARSSSNVADGPSNGGGPAGSGAVGGGWQSIWNFVKARIPQARQNSTVRPGDPGYHGRGKAIDFGFGSGPGGAGSAGLASINRLLHDELGRNLAELIYDGIGDDRPDLKNGRPLTYNAATRAQHRNHVHAAVYDDGGWLKPGYTLAYNGTGRDERVRTATQESALGRTAPLMYVENQHIESKVDLDLVLREAEYRQRAGAFS